MTEKTKNVIDRFKYWETDAIKADLDTRRFNYSVICCNIQGDFNIGSVIRNANAFLAREVIIYGRKQWDRRGAVGTHNYTNFRHVREVEDLSALKSDGVFIGVDNVPSATAVDSFVWPTDHFFLIFGEENSGIPLDIRGLCDRMIYIRQHGSVRSLNVGSAAAVTMYEYTRYLTNNRLCRERTIESQRIV